jgi:hypothetical protein
MPCLSTCSYYEIEGGNAQVLRLCGGGGDGGPNRATLAALGVCEEDPLFWCSGAMVHAPAHTTRGMMTGREPNVWSQPAIIIQLHDKNRISD